MFIQSRNLILALGLAASTTGMAANNIACDAKATKYQGLAQKAQQQQQYTDALRWQNKAVESCGSYQNFELLGEMASQASHFDTALKSYQSALDQASSVEEQATAIAKYSATLVDKGGLDIEALSLIKKARKLHPNPPQWMNALAMRLDESIRENPLTEEVVKRGLGTTTIKELMTIEDIDSKVGTFSVQLKTETVARSLDMQINFLSGSTEMDDVSRQNLSVLASSLTGDSFTGKTIWLVGHSDERGDDTYNWRLSEQRAQAAYKALVDLQPVLATSIKVKGMGETRPLYRDQSNAAYRLNRRLEVVVE